MTFPQNIIEEKLSKQIHLTRDDVGMQNYDNIIDVRKANIIINNRNVSNCFIDIFPLCICFYKYQMFKIIKFIEDWRALDTITLDGHGIALLFKGTSIYTSSGDLEPVRIYKIQNQNQEYFQFICNFYNSITNEKYFLSPSSAYCYNKKFSRPDVIITNSFFRKNQNVNSDGIQLQKYFSKHPESFNFKIKKNSIDLEAILDAIEISRTIKEVTINTNEKKQIFEKFIENTKSVEKVTFDLPPNEKFLYDFTKTSLKEIEVISPILSLKDVCKLLSLSNNSGYSISVIFNGCLKDDIFEFLPNQMSPHISKVVFCNTTCNKEKLIGFLSNGNLSGYGANNMNLSLDDVMDIISGTKANAVSFEKIFGLKEPKKNFKISREVKTISFANTQWSSKIILDVINGICNYEISDISVDLSKAIMSDAEWKLFNSHILNYRSQYVIGLSLNNIFNPDQKFIQFCMNFPRLFKLELRGIFKQNSVLLKPLISLIKTTKSLDYLDISDNGLEYEQLKRLLNKVTSNQTLMTFLFQGHNCNSSKPIINLLTNNPRLIRISFDSEMLGLAEARTIAKKVLEMKRKVLLDWPIKIAAKAETNFNEIANLFEMFYEIHSLPVVEPPEKQRVLPKVTRPQYSLDGKRIRRKSEFSGITPGVAFDEQPTRKKLNETMKETTSLSNMNFKFTAGKSSTPSENVSVFDPDEVEVDNNKPPVFIGMTEMKKQATSESIFDLELDEKLLSDEKKANGDKHSLKSNPHIKKPTPFEADDAIAKQGVSLDEGNEKDVWRIYEYKNDESVEVDAPMIERPPKEFFLEKFQKYIDDINCASTDSIKT